MTPDPGFGWDSAILDSKPYQKRRVITVMCRDLGNLNFNLLKIKQSFTI
jgi:hypothetical protein